MGHFEKATYSGELYLLMAIEASRLISSWPQHERYWAELEDISNLKILLNASAGHCKRCGRPHVVRRQLFTQPWLSTFL